MTIGKGWTIAAYAATAALAIGATAQYAEACTRILSNEKGAAVLVARTMDWPFTTEPVLTVMPRGLARDGGRVGAVVVVRDNPLKWTSKYGSLVTTVYGIGAADGVNERGLVAHVLFFRSADYGLRDASKPGLQATLQAQYALDNAATVGEALGLLQKVQLVMAEVQRNGETLHATLHLALEDATGDSAIVEVVDGKQVVYHGRQYRVMTNDPPYDQQLELLKAHDFSHPTSDTPVPGNVNPRDRFARATYFLAVLATAKTERDGVAGMFSIARNVSIPFGAPVGSGTYDTEYRTVTDATNKRYFFELTTAPNVIWVELKKLNLNAGASVMTLQPDNINLSGDVTGKFEAAAAPY